MEEHDCYSTGGIPAGKSYYVCDVCGARTDYVVAEEVEEVEVEEDEDDQDDEE